MIAFCQKMNNPRRKIIASPDYQQREPYRQNLPYPNSYGQSSPTGPLGQSNTGPLGYSNNAQHTGNTGHMPAVNPGE